MNLGFSQDDFGQLCDVKRRTLQDWERGLNTPSGDFLAAAHEHGMDVLYVIAGVRSAVPSAESLRLDQLHLLQAYEGLQESARPSLISFLGQVSKKP